MVDGSPPLQIFSPVVLIAPALNALYSVTVHVPVDAVNDEHVPSFASLV